MESIKPFYKMLNEICEEKQIEQKEISYGWIRELKKDNKAHYIMRYQFDLNSEIAYNIAGDKFATYEVLKSNNIPTIEHRMIFSPETRSGYYENKFIDEAKELLINNNNKVVIKANNSCQGKDVFICVTEEEIEIVVTKLFEEKNDTLSACPYLDIDFEYRVVYLDGEILFVYKKRKPYVTGNGKNTIRELIDLKFKDQIKVDLCRKVNLDMIPEDGEEVTISWKHNLNNGAEPIVIDETDEFLKEVKSVAVKAGNAVNIKFATIDVAVTHDKKVLVMEINASVCMNKFSEIVPGGFDIAKNVYAKAVDKMFE